MHKIWTMLQNCGPNRLGLWLNQLRPWRAGMLMRLGGRTLSLHPPPNTPPNRDISEHALPTAVLLSTSTIRMHHDTDAPRPPCAHGGERTQPAPTDQKGGVSDLED